METKDKIEQLEQIELFSDEVQHVLGTVPPQVVQWGMTVMFVLLLGLVGVSLIYSYPDVISAPVRVTVQRPRATIFVRSGGKIQQLLVGSGAHVKKGEVLLIMESETSPADWKKADSLARLEEGAFNKNAPMADLKPVSKLGTLQAAFDQLRRCCAVNGKVEKPLVLAAILNWKKAVAHWQQQFLVCSPSDGVVQLDTAIVARAKLAARDSIGVIVEKEQVRGIIRLTPGGSGKVRAGQQVHVRVENYPYMEYGTLSGIVLKMDPGLSEGQEGGYYKTEITFPDGLLTDHDHVLTGFAVMSGKADVVTNKRTLFNRFMKLLRLN